MLLVCCLNLPLSLKGEDLPINLLWEMFWRCFFQTPTSQPRNVHAQSLTPQTVFCTFEFCLNWYKKRKTGPCVIRVWMRIDKGKVIPHLHLQFNMVYTKLVYLCQVSFFLLFDRLNFLHCLLFRAARCVSTNKEQRHLPIRPYMGAAAMLKKQMKIKQNLLMLRTFLNVWYWTHRITSLFSFFILLF